MTSGGPHFGTLLRKLRTERGLSQSALAGLAGLSLPSITRAEASEKSSWKRSTARQVFQTLNAEAPIDPASTAAYFRATGLTAGLAAAGEWARTPEGKSAAALARFLEELPDERERIAVGHLFTLLDQLGAESVIDALHGFAAGRGVQLGEQAPPRVLRVHEPPVQKDGYTEQVIRDVEPAKPRPRARRRRASE